MMGLQLTMHSEAPITNWILSESLSHKIGRAQQFSILKWKQNKRDQSQAGPEDTNKLHEELAKMFMMLNPVNYSSSQPAPKAPGGVPCHQVTEEGKTQLGLEVLLHDM